MMRTESSEEVWAEKSVESMRGAPPTVGVGSNGHWRSSLTLVWSDITYDGSNDDHLAEQSRILPGTSHHFYRYIDPLLPSYPNMLYTHIPIILHQHSSYTSTLSSASSSHLLFHSVWLFYCFHSALLFASWVGAAGKTTRLLRRVLRISRISVHWVARAAKREWRPNTTAHAQAQLPPSAPDLATATSAFSPSILHKKIRLRIEGHVRSRLTRALPGLSAIFILVLLPRPYLPLSIIPPSPSLFSFFSFLLFFLFPFSLSFIFSFFLLLNSFHPHSGPCSPHSLS